MCTPSQYFLPGVKSSFREGIDLGCKGVFQDVTLRKIKFKKIVSFHMNRSVLNSTKKSRAHTHTNTNILAQAHTKKQTDHSLYTLNSDPAYQRARAKE